MSDKTEEKKGDEAPTSEAATETETALAKRDPDWTRATVDPATAGKSLIPVNFQSFKAAWDFCVIMCNTGFLPKAVKEPGQAMAIAIFGQELGIPLMTSFRTIHVVNGKPGLAAEMMLTKFMERGGVVKWAETSATKCEGLFISKGVPDGFQSEFTIEKAQKAGLASKDVWKNYPEDMLRARCISRGVRGSDPGAIGGSHSPEELGGDVLTDGTVIDVKPDAPVPTNVDLGAPMTATTPEETKEDNASGDGDGAGSEGDGRPEPHDANPSPEASPDVEKEEKAAPAPAATSGDNSGLFDD